MLSVSTPSARTASHTSRTKMFKFLSPIHGAILVLLNAALRTLNPTVIFSKSAARRRIKIKHNIIILKVLASMVNGVRLRCTAWVPSLCYVAAVPVPYSLSFYPAFGAKKPCAC